MTDSKTRSRGWCFTINNYADETIAALKGIECQYLVFGRETAPTTGTPHLQGFVYFDTLKSFSVLKKLLPEGTHIERAKGNCAQNREYCTKDGAFEEQGTLPIQGKRTDIQTIKDMVREGNHICEIAEVATSYQTLKFAQTLLSIKPNTELRLDLRVHWFYGATGTGKTRAAYAEATTIGETWISSRNLKWWDGYTGQPCVIVDDMRGDFCTFHEMLRILDIYPLRLEVKGGSVAAAYHHIWITSAFRPETLWASIEDKGQLLRRIHEIREFPYKFSTPVSGIGDAPEA